MALLLRDREATPEVAHAGDGDEPVVVPDYACAACGAGMEGGQDWCLECGTAAPGRLESRPGWRAALTVVATTLLLVLGAVVASYAAISGDAEREASRPAPEAADPIVAQTPPPPAARVPVTPPPSTATPVPAPAPSQPRDTSPAVPAPTPAPATSAPPTPTPGAGGGSAAAAPDFARLDLRAGSLGNYDPYDREGAEIGPPGAAADGLRDTVWDVVVPADGHRIKVGLLVDLGKPRTLASVRIHSPTPGYTVEVYGAESGVPDDILDKRWTHLSDGRDAGSKETIRLAGKSDGRFRRLVLWFTTPPNPEDPRVAVGEITVRATK